MDKIRFTKKTRTQLHHLERMVNDMLLFARGGVTESECFSVGQIMEQLQQLLEPRFAEANGRLKLDVKIPDAPLCGNREALLGAFQNLANNAIDAGGADPVLEIRADLSFDDTVVFSFSDEGCGLSDDIKERILEPFFTTKSNGTGLGLAVVNATVSSHHGELDIQSESGVGSCFTIKLLLAEQSGVLPSELTSLKSDVKLVLKPRFKTNFNSNYFRDDKEVTI